MIYGLAKATSGWRNSTPSWSGGASGAKPPVDALADLPAAADESEIADAQEWLAHCQDKNAAIARVIDELQNPARDVVRLDNQRKR